jgi:hypothetical protein
VRLFDCGFECREIDLPQGPLVDNDVYLASVCFLVVAREVFDASAGSSGLHAFDVRNGEAGVEVRVFAEIFAVAAIERTAMYVDRRSKFNLYSCTFVLGFLADGPSY